MKGHRVIKGVVHAVCVSWCTVALELVTSSQSIQEHGGIKEKTILNIQERKEKVLLAQ